MNAPALQPWTFVLARQLANHYATTFFVILINYIVTLYQTNFNFFP